MRPLNFLIDCSQSEAPGTAAAEPGALTCLKTSDFRLSSGLDVHTLETEGQRQTGHAVDLTRLQ